MESVSAAKMRKAQRQVLATRPYAKQAREVLSYLARLSSTEHDLNPLIQVRPVRRAGILLITADRGLAGGFNANVLRTLASFMRKKRSEGAEITVVTVGAKGAIGCCATIRWCGLSSRACRTAPPASTSARSFAR